MRTPHPKQDLDLVRGFLYSEGLIDSPADISSLVTSAHPTSQEVHATLAHHAIHNQPQAREFFLSSSCGVCGRATIHQLTDRIPQLPTIAFEPQRLHALHLQLNAAQRHFQSTGGLHAAALFTISGDLLAVSEDVGRHNALDKLIGAHLDVLPLDHHVLLMTSRASFDIVQKAARAGIPIVATFGAASSLAVELARALNLRLFSFLREHSVVEFSASAIDSF